MVIDKQTIPIIKQISPLYNLYIGNKLKLSGTESLKIMWDIGEILKTYIKRLNIKPHNLYRKIYGKSEGNKNIVQKSYITREFQGRCYRIRNIFNSKSEIESLFPNLVSFTCFRESMPFFDNPSYKMEGQKKKELLLLLNSNKKPSEVLNEIRSLQKNYIGKINPRTQKLEKVENERAQFVFIYNNVYNLLKEDDYNIVKEKLKGISSQDIILFSQLTSSLLAEEIIPPKYSRSMKYPEPFKSLVTLIDSLYAQKKMIMRNRFRRLVRIERISSLANMIFALSSNDAYNNHHSS